MKALETALHSLLTGDTTLIGSVNAVYLAGVSKPTYPYVRVRKVSQSPPEYTYQSRILHRYQYDIAVIDKSESKAIIQTALERIYALLELKTLAVTGYTCQPITSLGDMPDMAELDDDGRMMNQVGASFEIVLAK